MIIYILSRLDSYDIICGGQDNLGYYSNLTNAYNKLKEYTNDIPDINYVNMQIEKNGYYDIAIDYYTGYYVITKEILDK